MNRQLTDTDRAAVAQNLRHTQVVKISRILARMVKTEHPSTESLRRRKRLESHLKNWLKYYMPDTFPDAWGTVHLNSLITLQNCIEQGGCFAVAMPRGDGKSSIGKGACVYAALTGKRKYLVPIGATDDLAAAYLEFIKNQLDGSNEKIAIDYPEAIKFFQDLDWKAIKGPHQIDEKKRKTGISWRARGITFPKVYKTDGVNLYPFSGTRIECRGITAAMKGMAKTIGGKIIRPDFVLPDDVQTEDDAISIMACNKIENKIIGTVLAMAGPRKRIACFMPCTIVERDDVSCRFLDKSRHPEFQGVKHPMIISWPKAQETLWGEYADIRRGADNDAHGKKLATEFYKLHKTEMDDGVLVSWESRIRDGEISAIETAENLLIEMGKEKFGAEMQQEPPAHAGNQYKLTTKTILNHAVNIPRLHIPEASTVFVGHCDINRSGLHWCVAGFDQSMTGHCPAYGRWPQRGDLWEKNAPELIRKQAIFRGLKELCGALTATTFMRGEKRVQLELFLIDRGYEPDVVQKFCAAAVYPFRVMPARGYAAHKYWPRKAFLVGKPLEGCHITKSDNGNFLAFNADLWRETSQRAFLAEPGAPGGFTLYESPSEKYHIHFAEQVIAEELVNKYETDAGIRWEWAHQPGNAWDWGDALTGCWASAAAKGLSASGQPEGVKTKPRRRAGGISVINL